MNRLFLIPFIFLALLTTTVNAEEFYNCVDSNGNKVITNSPQDGIKCETGNAHEESSSLKKPSTNNHSTGNLIDKCESLYSESEEISDEIKSFDSRLAELQKEQLDIRQKNINKNRDYYTEYKETKHIRDEQYKINKQISLLHQKKSLIGNDIRINKCDQIKQDLSRLNRGSNTVNNYTYPKSRKKTIIIRNGGSSLIIRN